MKLLLSLFFILPFCSFSQHSDFLMLKKKNKTLQYYYSGSQIEFFTNTGAYRNALITGIKNDSIYLQEFYVIRRPTTFGSITLDTAGSFRYVYHYRQVHSFGPKKQKGFNMSGSAAALVGGGTLLTLASGVSYLADKEKFSPELLCAAVGLGGLGLIMAKSSGKGMLIGKKYQLAYMKMN